MPVKYKVRVISTVVTERECLVFADNAEAAGKLALADPAGCSDVVWGERTPIDGDSYINDVKRA